MMNVAVIGLESSGTQWVTGILDAHPDLAALHFSFPSDGGGDRRYPSLPEDLDKVVIVCRDASCQRASVKRRRYNKGREGEFGDGESVARIARAAGEAGCPVLYVSYEGLLVYRSEYLAWIWDRLGVPWFPGAVEYIDGNEKYFTGL